MSWPLSHRIHGSPPKIFVPNEHYAPDDIIDEFKKHSVVKVCSPRLSLNKSSISLVEHLIIKQFDFRLVSEAIHHEGCPRRQYNHVFYRNRGFGMRQLDHQEYWKL